jgi:hypothetical protein
MQYVDENYLGPLRFSADAVLIAQRPSSVGGGDNIEEAVGMFGKTVKKARKGYCTIRRRGICFDTKPDIIN